MHRLNSRLLAVLAGSFVLLAGVTCADSSTGPGSKSGLRALVGLVPAFSRAAAEVYRNLVSFAIAVNNIHVRLERADGTVVVDTTITVTPGQDSVVLQLNVPIAGLEELLEATIELRDGNQVLFSGTQNVIARPGANSSAPPTITLTYTGPGATATTLDVLPDTAMSAIDTLVLRPVAHDANGQVVSNLALLWSVNNATLALVTADGVLKPTGTRGTVVASAALPTGITGSATITLIPPPASLALISGGGQSTVAGTALSQPIVVEVLATDGLPVAGAAVGFSATSGGGSASPTSAVTDANGRASTTFTLGSTAGPNTVRAATGPLFVDVTATGNPGVATTMALQGGASHTVVAGQALANPPSIFVTDASGNAVGGAPIRVVVTRGATTVSDATINSGADGRVSLSGVSTAVAAGAYVITASNAALTGNPAVVSLTITHAGAHHLAFAQQPSNNTGGIPFSPGIIVEVLDEFGGRVTTGAAATTNIALTLAGGAPGAAIGGTSASAAVAGVATFDVSVNIAATGYTLSASASSIIGATSGAFNIAVGPAAQLISVSGNEQGALMNEALPLPLVVRVTDAGGNPVSLVNVNFQIDSGNGQLNGGSTPVLMPADVNGQAQVNWSVTTGQQLVTVTSVNALTLQLRAYIAERVMVVTQPSPSPQSGIQFAQQPSVRLTDNAGNLVRRSGLTMRVDMIRVDPVDVTMFLSGTDVVTTTIDGVAAYANLTLAGEIIQQVQLKFYRLVDGEVEDSTITSAFSETIALQPGPASEIIAVDVAYHLVNAAGTTTLSVRTGDGYNNVPGAPVSFAVVQGNCTIANAPSATDGSGLANFDVTITGQLRSCVLRGQVVPPPPPPCPGGCEVAPPPSVDQRLYLAPLGMPVWTGQMSSAWIPTGNWFNGISPSVSPAFIPGASDFDNRPTLPTGTTSLQSLMIESGTSLNLNGQTLALSDSLVAEGPITGGGSVTLTATSNGRVRGSVEAVLVIGPSGGACGANDYSISGSLSVDRLGVNCQLTLDQNADVVVLQDLNVNTPSGKLVQSNGKITVGWDAIFNNASALLTDGTLELQRNLIHTGDCEQWKFEASGEHVTRFTGDATDTLRVRLNDCANFTTFGRLEIATTGASGVTFASNQVSESFEIGDLHIAAGSRLRVSSTFTITAGGVALTGVHVLEGGVLTNEGSISVGGGPECSPIPQAVISGPFSCTTPAS